MNQVQITSIKVSATGATVELSPFSGTVALTRLELAKLAGEIAVQTWRATIQAQQMSERS